MARVVVYHAEYGCDTGCCGHYVELYDESPLGDSEFTFDHPWSAMTEEQKLDWAKELVKNAFGEDHVKDLDWENCVIVNC